MKLFASLGAATVGIGVALAACSDDGVDAAGADAPADASVAAQADAAAVDVAPSDALDGQVAVDDAGDTSSPDAAPRDAGPPAIRYVGRIVATAGGGAQFEWSGSSARIRFTGASLGIRITSETSNPSFDVLVDGALVKTFTAASGTHTVTVASGLSTRDSHTVELYRLTEASAGVTEIGAISELVFDGDGGALLPPEAPASRRIAILGASISCGFGDEGRDASCSGYGYENHYDSFGAVTARSFGAELVTTAWGGKGMYRDYTGAAYDGSMASREMPQLFPLTLPTRSTPLFDYQSFVPDVLVINVGADDIATGDPGMPYEDAYVSFLTLARQTYPSAFILGTVGPLWQTDLTIMSQHIENAIATWKAKSGGANVDFLAFPSNEQIQAGDAGFGCEDHPTVATHAVMASLLEAELHAKLGW